MDFLSFSQCHFLLYKDLVFGSIYIRNIIIYFFKKSTTFVESYNIFLTRKLMLIDAKKGVVPHSI